MIELYQLLKQKIINLDKKNIYIEDTKNYFGFKYRRINRSFANVYVQKKLIRIHLSTLLDYTDNKKLLRQVSYEGWGPLRNYVEIKSINHLDDAMALVEQSFNRIALLNQELLFDSINNPKENYGTLANFMNKAKDFSNLLNTLIITKRIGSNDELKIVKVFLEKLKAIDDLPVLLLFCDSDFRERFNNVIRSKELDVAELKTIEAFEKVLSQRINGIYI
jgi:predicted transport protein